MEHSVSSDVYITPSTEHTSLDPDELDIATVPESSAAAVYKGAKLTYVEVALLLVQYALWYSLYVNFVDKWAFTGFITLMVEVQFFNYLKLDDDQVVVFDVLIKKEAKHSDMIDILKQMVGYLGESYPHEK